MPLTQDQANRLLNDVAGRAGCPVTVSDRIDAFMAGMKTAVTALMPLVTEDKKDVEENTSVPKTP